MSNEHHMSERHVAEIKAALSRHPDYGVLEMVEQLIGHGRALLSTHYADELEDLTVVENLFDLSTAWCVNKAMSMAEELEAGVFNVDGDAKPVTPKWQL